MAWPNPFRQSDENTRTCWGYTFQLTPDHLTTEERTRLRFSYDKLADECLDILNEISPPGATQALKHTKPPGANNTTADEPAKRDLYLLLEAHRGQHPKLQDLWDSVTTIPPWVDWDQIQRGQDVFYRYGGATIMGLAYQSLLGGMGANRIAEVLARTGGFSVKVARHRLFETTKFVLECTQSLASIQKGGAGFASAIRVRLLHAAVRKRIMKLAENRPEYYDVQAYGVPVNDLDCIATIGSFSTNIVWLSLPRQGVFPLQQEETDYIALWRLIAHYMGTSTDFFSTPAKAKAVMETLIMTEIKPSPTSATLANNVIRCLENTPPAYASRSFLETGARWLNGNELCDSLGLGRPAWYYWVLVAGQCLLFCTVYYLYRILSWVDPRLDQRKIRTVKAALWEVVDGKHGLQGEKTVFEFKHIPQLGTHTEAGPEEEKRARRRDTEWRSAQTLVLALGFCGVLAWSAMAGAKLVLSSVL
ncbi:hypothetical protein DV737_g4888, partial [Chaetothyriales sp. CBS 132003]